MRHVRKETLPVARPGHRTDATRRDVTCGHAFTDGLGAKVKRAHARRLPFTTSDPLRDIERLLPWPEPGSFVFSVRSLWCSDRTQVSLRRRTQVGWGTTRVRLPVGEGVPGVPGSSVGSCHGRRVWGRGVVTRHPERDERCPVQEETRSPS